MFVVSLWKLDLQTGEAVVGVIYASVDVSFSSSMGPVGNSPQLWITSCLRYKVWPFEAISLLVGIDSR